MEVILLNIGVYDPATKKFVNVWNGVTDIEKKGLEVWFNHGGAPAFFYARRENYVIVPEDIPLTVGDDVTPEILAADQKGTAIKDPIKTITQQQIDQDITLVFLFETLVSKGLI